VFLFFSGQSKSITITNESGRLSHDEIDRFLKDVKQFADQDSAQKMRVEALDNLSTVYKLKNQMGD
jgi:endoplasmic reticulum chaperone BiP